LPARVRDPALALYAFCRLADDEVDEGADKGRAVLTLRDRLDLAYRGRPRNAPEDRAFTALIEDFDMPRALPEALLEGLAWDATGRQYQTLSGVLDYSARVAAAVGEGSMAIAFVHQFLAHAQPSAAACAASVVALQTLQFIATRGDGVGPSLVLRPQSPSVPPRIVLQIRAFLLGGDASES
jgi:phytoene/squalene synthetase